MQATVARSPTSTSSSPSGPRSDRELLNKCWDIEKIADAYRDFIRAYEPVGSGVERDDDLNDEDAFVERLWLVHDYRKFVYVDPGLPSTLLPAHWPGTTAAALFREYYAALKKKSQRYFHLCSRVPNGAEHKSVEASRPCPNA